MNTFNHMLLTTSDNCWEEEVAIRSLRAAVKRTTNELGSLRDNRLGYLKVKIQCCSSTLALMVASQAIDRLAD